MTTPVTSRKAIQPVTPATCSPAALSIPHPLRFDELRIENTNRCGYRCFFCPRDKHTRTQGVMPISDLELVLDRIGTHEGRMDLHGFGEPLLDPFLLDKVALVTRRWPAVHTRIFTSLGVPVEEGYFDELFKAGLGEVHVSFYGFDAVTYQQTHGVDRYDLARRNLERLSAASCKLGKRAVIVRSFPDHETVHQPGTSSKRRDELRNWLDRLSVGQIRRPLHNHGNGRQYNPARSGSLCSIVNGYRRRILEVTWDLYVIPCTFDFNAEVRFGNLRHQSLREIFEGEPYARFIRSHVEDRLRNYPVCEACERCHQP